MEKKTKKSKKELTDSIISEIVEKNKKVPVKKLTKTLGKIRKMKSTKIQSFENNLEDWLITPDKAFTKEEQLPSIRSMVEDYFAYPAVNNSLLNMLSNPIWIKWKEENRLTEDGEKRAYKIGSAVDCLLTDPNSFESTYYISELSRPNGLMGVFIDKLQAGLTVTSDLEEYRSAYNKAGYKSKIETIVKNLWEKPECVDYYQAKGKSNGKIILAKDDYDEVKWAVNNISKNKETAYYFTDKYDEGKNIERIFQKAIYFDYKEGSQVIPCKGLLDLILIDHNQKTIQPCDLKTTGSIVYEFEKSFYEYSYFRQCAFYHIAIQWWLQKEASDTIKNYKVLPFKFIVTPKSDNGYPAIIYEVSEETLNKGLDGAYYNGKFYPGLIKLLSDYAWHKEMNFWDVPRDIYESNYTKIL
jgi:hypothetical protein